MDVEVAILPLAQVEQLDKPVVFAMYPAGHEIQIEEALAADVFPASHCVQVDDCVVEYSPARHESQLERPFF